MLVCTTNGSGTYGSNGPMNHENKRVDAGLLKSHSKMVQIGICITKTKGLTLDYKNHIVKCYK